jgi:hypothetical protein
MAVGRVVISTVDEAEVTAFPVLTGVSRKGDVLTKAVIAESSRPLLLWQHTLAPGSQITWWNPSVGHVAYLWDGEAEADGKPLHKGGGALIIAHGGRAVLKAGNAPATILHFHRPEDHPVAPARAGGCSHVVNRVDTRRYILPETTGYLYAGASCPTCELWLHENAGGSAGKAPQHYHTEDEIIFIVGGSMIIGRRKLKPGAALAIDADTVYQFEAGEDGLAFINFRPCEPGIGMVENGRRGKPISELDATLDLIAKTEAGVPIIGGGKFTGAN